MIIISSLAKTRITRTSSKNIMPVLDTGHLVAFLHGMLETGGGGRGELEEGEGGERREGGWGGGSFKAGIKGEL